MIQGFFFAYRFNEKEEIHEKSSVHSLANLSTFSVSNRTKAGYEFHRKTRYIHFGQFEIFEI